MSTKKIGDWGESVACEYLVKKGYKILGRNYRIKFGEIDIIVRKKSRLFAKNDKTIHFIEVKTIFHDNSNKRRPSIIGDGNFFPEDKVDYRKRRKLVRLTEIWLMKNGFSQNCPHQIDVIGIVVNISVELLGSPTSQFNWDVGDPNIEIRHFENVVEGLPR